MFAFIKKIINKLSNKPIYKWFKDNGISTKKNNRPKIPTKTILLKDLEELTVNAITVKYGITNSTFYIWKDKLGIKSKGSSRDSKIPSKEIFIQDLNNLSLRNIAKKYCVSINTLYNWRIKYNLKIRSKKNG